MRPAWISAMTVLTLTVTGADGNEGWFWHITDFHWDFSYWDGQLSCNGQNVSSPGEFGDYWCDSPYSLVLESITKMAEVKRDVDFILWTGDSVPHVPLVNLSQSRNQDIVRNLTATIKSAFSSIPVYATFGNHDYYKKDQFPPHGNDIYNMTLLLWETWINDSSQLENFRKGGYYTVKRNNIRIIAMNTNLYYTGDQLTVNVSDPADQFAWLDSVLTQAVTNNEKVIITGHVPPGFTTPRKVMWMRPQFNIKMNEIINRHATVIAGMHFAHEHHDNFRLYYDSKGNPSVALFIAPSITPWRYIIGSEIEPKHNPGARLVKYDRESGRQYDIQQYYVDLPQANKDGNLKWKLGYNATTEYDIPDVTPASLETLVQKMSSATSQKFLKFVLWYNTNATEFPCNDTCHKSVLCGIKNMDESAFNQCLQNDISFATMLTPRMTLPLVILPLYVLNTVV
ncbi:hypothetical protein ACJMK2_012167 [Sinanodonta woodiana]|uniref:Sphingomyelinase phosphodiesterase n=1 Tax=Sinanodonta woodiana TaxID=1069815 RepID=A0ABD3V8F9_SINWO